MLTAPHATGNVAVAWQSSRTSPPPPVTLSPAHSSVSAFLSPTPQLYHVALPTALGEHSEILPLLVPSYLASLIPSSLKANSILDFSHKRLRALWEGEKPADGSQETGSAL